MSQIRLDVTLKIANDQKPTVTLASYLVAHGDHFVVLTAKLLLTLSTTHHLLSNGALVDALLIAELLRLVADMGSGEPPVERRPSGAEDEGDENRLAQFGYKQELRRDWGLAHNFGVSFSIIVSRKSANTSV